MPVPVPARNEIDLSKLINFVKKERLTLGGLVDIEKRLLDLHSFVVPPTDKLGLAELLVAATELLATPDLPNFAPGVISEKSDYNVMDFDVDPVRIQLRLHNEVTRAYTEGDYWMPDCLMAVIKTVARVSASETYGFDLPAAINTVLGCDYLTGFDS